MNDDNGINDPKILLSGTNKDFMKKYKEVLKLKAQSINPNPHTGKSKIYATLIRNNNLTKYKTMSKLPTINFKNNNYNYIQYLNNTNNISVNKKINYQLSPKNHIFNFSSFINNHSGKNVEFKKLNPYKKSSEYANNLYLNNSFKNKIIFGDGNITNIHKNNKVKLSKINGDFINDKKEIIYLNQYKLMNRIHNFVSPKKFIQNIKYTNKNKSTENFNFNIKKININNNKNKLYRNENIDLIKVSNELYKSENINQNSNSDINLNIKELKNSNSEQNIFQSTKRIKKINIKDKTNSYFNTKKINNENSFTMNNYNKNYFIVYPGNNGKLIENIILTRPNWEKLPINKKKHDCNFLWTPLSIQVNFNFHKSIDNFHIVNHFEFQNELTNKRNIFINLLKYCELNNINLFSFYPLTIILPLNNDNFNIALENFKKCYFDLPNLVEDPENKNSNFLDKYYRNYFHVKSNLKLGSTQKLIIPKSHYKMKNLWLIKRINLNRGREIKVLNDLEKIINEINQIKSELKVKYIIIQKYIEKPLLYCGRKFDIRIWVLFTYLLKVNKFEAYVFKEGHLKASSEIFDLNNLDLFIHLTNYSVQKYNKNFSKNEIGNEISFNTFQKELDKNNKEKVNFKKDIFVKIIQIIGITANIAKNKINGFNRKNCFEIFGYDFILDEDYNPFLLEINTNPGYEISSPLIEKLVPRMIDDALRLTIDKAFERKDKNKKFSLFPVDDYSVEENMWQKIKL